MSLFLNKQNLIILLMNCLYSKAYEVTEADCHRKSNLRGHGAPFLIIKLKKKKKSSQLYENP